MWRMLAGVTGRTAPAAIGPRLSGFPAILPAICARCLALTDNGRSFIGRAPQTNAMSENTPLKPGQSSQDLSAVSSSDSFAVSHPAPGQSAAAGTASSGAAPAATAPPGPAATSPGSAAATRAATDALDSASAVQPAPSQSSAAEAAEARANAVRETASQEAGVRQSAFEAAPRGAVPLGFGAPPDFDVSRPPPATAAPLAGKPAYLKQSDSPWSVVGRTIAARARRLFDRAGQRITQRTLRIGVSARIFHPEPGAMGLRGKTLQYLEESVANWVMSRDVMVFMIPTVGHQGMLHPSNIRLRDYAKQLDGLLLQGGADVSPQTYAATEVRAEWPGDRVRDMYELELLHEFIESGKPVLGICRGCQLINVAFGGTLYQDIATEVPTAGAHVNERYDQHRHPVRFPDGSTLVNMFPGRREAIVNSIHHQAVKTLGRDLNVEAVSSEDGIIEALRYRRAPFVMGVQWHPEFHRAGGPELLDCTPLLDTFLRAARETRF